MFKERYIMPPYLCCNCERVFYTPPIILPEYDNSYACSSECATDYETRMEVGRPRTEDPPEQTHFAFVPP